MLRDRRCHGDDSTEAGWMLAVRAELKAGQLIILQRLMEAKCSRPFLRAGNTEVVRQDGGSPFSAIAGQPMSSLKGAAAAERDPEEKTNNVEAAVEVELEAAKRKLNFEDQAEEMRAPKFKGAPPSDEQETETPAAEESEDVSETAEDDAVERNLQAEGEDQEKMPSELLRVRNCSVKLHSIDKMLPAGLVERAKKRMMEKSRENVKLEEIAASHPEMRKCTVLLNDLKNHPWYGSKISGMTPCESSTMKVQAEIKEEAFADSDEEMMAVLAAEEGGQAQTGAAEDPHTDSDDEMLATLKNMSHESGGQVQTGADEDSRSDSDSANESGPDGGDSGDEDEREQVLDLSQMKKCVDDCEYTRVLSFHLAFKQVLATVHVPGPGKYLARNAIKKVYKSAVALAFPWFDVSNPAANYEANTVEERMVRPPTGDHVYADRRLISSRAAEKVDEQNEISEQVPRWKKYRKRNRAILARDTRKCLFCHQQGDADRSRLIYFRQNGEVALCYTQYFPFLTASIRGL